jgi:hypothetical protein
MRITNVFTGGSDGYEEEHPKDRKEAFVAEDLVRPAGEEGHSFFKNGTYAQDRGLPGNKCLVLWETMFDTMILEYYRFVHVFIILNDSPHDQGPRVRRIAAACLTSGAECKGDK